MPLGEKLRVCQAITIVIIGGNIYLHHVNDIHLYHCFILNSSESFKKGMARLTRFSSSALMEKV